MAPGTWIAAGFLALCAGGATADCAVRDFLTMPLPEGDPMEIVLELGYPGSDLDPGAATFTAPNGQVVPYAPARVVDDPKARADDATIGDMFVDVYVLGFDLSQRNIPWDDAGRVRNDALFHALYGDSREEVGAGLVTVTHAGGAAFAVTTRHCVDAQLAAALSSEAALAPEAAEWFRDVGGSFNWRTIAGTERLSVHSFGAAIDLNAELGGYWRWAGVPEGAAGEFTTTIPPELVEAFERRGFIWGGKWHHYDGMHFEYRPDLILYARLVARD